MKKICSTLLLTLLITCMSFTILPKNSMDIAYTKEDVVSMTSFVGYNATQNANTKEVNVINNGCFIFNENYKNIEFIGEINFEVANSISLVMRTEDTISNGTYNRDTGYKFVWYSHGAGELYRQGTLIQSYPGGTIPALTDNTTYLLNVKIVDTTDGLVHIQIAINDTIYVDYIDEDISASITGTGFGIFNEGNSNYTLTGLDNYAQLEVNDLADFSGYNATLDSKTNNVTVINNGAFLFNSDYKNISINSKIVFDSTSAVQFIMRSTDTITSQTYSRTEGYHIMWYAHGALEVYRKDVLLQSLSGGEFPAMAVGTDYNFNIKIINTLAGHVLINVIVDGTTYVAYVDRSEDGALLNSGSYGMFNEGNSNYIVSGNGLNYPVISPFNVSSPKSSNSSNNTFEDDGSITLNANNAHANSGVTYELNTTGSFGYTLNVTPVDPGAYSSADIRFTIGQRLSAGVASIPDFYYESQTAWESCGYIVHWADNVVYITRGSNNQYLVPSINDAIYSTTCLPVEYGKTYRIELSITSFADDSTRIIFKIDDIIYLNYFDRPQDGYTPIYMPEPNKDILKNDVSNYVSVFSSPQVILNISPVDDEILNNASPNEVTTISSDLGPVDTSNSTISTDLNGVPTNFETGIIKYTGLNSNNVLTFNLNFSELGETIEIGYENGYSFKFKQNKVELYKNNNLIYVVDSTYVFIETKKDYLIEFKVLNLSNNKMAQISLKVNNEEMVNYLDSVNIINTTNNFYFKSDGFSGKINQIGYEIPKIIILNGINADGTECADAHRPFSLPNRRR